MSEIYEAGVTTLRLHMHLPSPALTRNTKPCLLYDDHRGHEASVMMVHTELQQGNFC